MAAGRVAVAATWLVAAVGVVLVLVLSPGAEALQWLALAVGLSVVVGMAGQLAVADRDGFVLRLAAAATGSFAVVAVGALVALARA